MTVLLTNGHVVTMDAARAIHDPGFVLIDDAGRIAATGPMADCPAGPDMLAIDCAGKIVLPGLIDLFQRHWTHLLPASAPAEAIAARMEVAEHAIAAGLAGEALVSGGVTTVLNAAPDLAIEAQGAVAAAFDAAGLRAVHAVPQDRMPSMAGAIWVDTDMPARVSGRATDASITAAVQAARTLGWRIVTRLWPDGATAEEMTAARRKLGRSAVQHLMEMGVLDDRWIVVSPLGLDDTDRNLLRESGCHVVDLPVAEAAAGSSALDITALSRMGVSIALGTDGPGRGGSCDMIEQMKYLLMTQNTMSLDPTSMSMEQVLEMATINAARALGLDGEIGSLEAGKRADVAVFDLGVPHSAVTAKPLSGFIACVRASEAELVLRDGRVIFRKGEAGSIRPSLEPAMAARRAILARMAKPVAA